MNNKEDKAARIKLANILREAREKAGLTQVEVATKAGLSSNYYSMIERGQRNLSFDKLQRIMKILHIKSFDL